MCIGIPMRVIGSQAGFALCEAQGRQQLVDTLLVGEQPVGTWLLTFLDSAREVLSEERALQIRGALQAVELAMQGADVPDLLFQDLLEHEPELPAFLRDIHDEYPSGE